MASAEVGDDVFGEDPTVRRLEEETAAMLGMQGAVFVPSGTMANQIAVFVHTQSGDEIWGHEASHVIDGEQGGVAVLARAQTRTFQGRDGILDPQVLSRWLRDPTDPHNAPRRLLCLENTMGYAGGAAFPPADQAELVTFAHDHGMRIHVDGARLWNAAVALGLPPSALTASMDSAAVCYSKGLGAPVGSAVAGDQDFTARARRARKLLGGGMRQAGVIAAGALHAVRHHVERLAEDHARARRLGEGLADISALDVDPTRVQTNIVFAHAPGHADRIAEELTQAGLGCLPFDADTIRFVTHLDVDDGDIERAIAIARSTLGRGRPRLSDSP